MAVLSGQSDLFTQGQLSEGVITYRAAMQEFERDLLIQALRRTRGNISQAARQINIPRRSFYHRLQILGIDASSIRQ